MVHFDPAPFGVDRADKFRSNLRASVPQIEPLGTILFSALAAGRPAAGVALSANFFSINFWHSFSSFDLAMYCKFDYRVDARMEAVGKVSFFFTSQAGFGSLCLWREQMTALQILYSNFSLLGGKYRVVLYRLLLQRGVACSRARLCCER
jgi:hypothetical protein